MRVLGVLLVLAAGVLAIAGFVLLDRAEDDVQRTPTELARDIVHGRAEDEPDRTPATVAWVTAGAAFLAGVVFVARPAPPPRQPSPREWRLDPDKPV